MVAEIIPPAPANGYDQTARKWISQGRCMSCGSNDVPLARNRWGQTLPRRIRRCRYHQGLFERYKRERS